MNEKLFAWMVNNIPAPIMGVALAFMVPPTAYYMIVWGRWWFSAL